jgi:hypothetical protein
MRALVWIVEDTWQATVAAAAAFLPADAEVTLLHVGDAEAERVVHVARNALLGRGRGRTPERATADPLAAISERAAQELLADARAALGTAAECRSLRGRIEREVVAATDGMDVLILARDGDREHLGPRSLGPAARFVVDHAACEVLLIWPDAAPSVETIAPEPGDSALPHV